MHMKTSKSIALPIFNKLPTKPLKVNEAKRINTNEKSNEEEGEEEEEMEMEEEEDNLDDE